MAQSALRLRVFEVTKIGNFDEREISLFSLPKKDKLVAYFASIALVPPIVLERDSMHEYS